MLQFLVFLLLIAPFDCTINLDGLRPTLEEAAIKLEILDVREIPYSLIHNSGFVIELKLLRQRYQEMKDMPPLSDARQFPPRDVIIELLNFNRRYLSFLEEKQKVDFVHSTEVKQAIEETNTLYETWSAMRDASCEFYYVNVRREALRKLLNKLGPEDYYTGNFPPYVPIWRFKKID